MSLNTADDLCSSFKRTFTWHIRSEAQFITYLRKSGFDLISWIASADDHSTSSLKIFTWVWISFGAYEKEMFQNKSHTYSKKILSKRLILLRLKDVGGILKTHFFGLLSLSFLEDFLFLFSVVVAVVVSSLSTPFESSFVASLSFFFVDLSEFWN